MFGADLDVYAVTRRTISSMLAPHAMHVPVADSFVVQYAIWMATGTHFSAVSRVQGRPPSGKRAHRVLVGMLKLAIPHRTNVDATLSRISARCASFRHHQYPGLTHEFQANALSLLEHRTS